MQLMQFNCTWLGIRWQLSTDILAAAGRLLQPWDASDTLAGVKDQCASRANDDKGILIGCTS